MPRTCENLYVEQRAKKNRTIHTAAFVVARPSTYLGATTLIYKWNGGNYIILKAFDQNDLFVFAFLFCSWSNKSFCKAFVWVRSAVKARPFEFSMKKGATQPFDLGEMKLNEMDWK